MVRAPFARLRESARSLGPSTRPPTTGGLAQDDIEENWPLATAFMDHGGQKHHRERLAEALRDEIGTILEGELADPRIGLVSVSEVHLAPDGRSARVFVSVAGDGDEAVRTMQGLSAARNFIRTELKERLRLRQAPELYFQLDNSSQYGARIEELLARIKKRQ